MERRTKKKNIAEKNKKKLKKDCRDNMQLLAKFITHRPAFFEMLQNLGSMWNGHVKCNNLSKHRNNLFRKDVSPVHSVSCRGEASINTIFCGGNKPVVRYKGYSAGNYETDSNYRSWMQKERFTAVFHRVPYVEQDHDRHFVAPLLHGRVYRQVGRGDCVRNAER